MYTSRVADTRLYVIILVAYLAAPARMKFFEPMMTSRATPGMATAAPRAVSRDAELPWMQRCLGRGGIVWAPFGRMATSALAFEIIHI
jgi:hypothetical protein